MGKELRIFGVLLALVLLVGLVSACAQQAPSPSPSPGQSPTATPATKKVSLTFAGVSPSDFQYRVEASAEAIRRNTGYSVTVYTGESATNAIRLDRGEVDLMATSAGRTVVQPLVETVIPGYKLGTLYSIFPMSSTAQQFIVRPETGLTSVQDIINKKYPLKVAVGLPASTRTMYNTATMKAYGMSVETIESWGGKIYYLGEQEATSNLRDGLIDANFGGFSLPNSGFVELSRTMKFKLLPLDNAQANKSLEAVGLSPGVIPAGSYAHITVDTPTVFSLGSAMARNGLSDEIVYNIAKAIDQQREYLYNSHAAFKELLAPETIVKVDILFPLHPGAAKYYREKGWLK